MSDGQQQEENLLEKLQSDLDTVTNNWKRALADFENFKKQKERENRELLEFAKEVTVVKLLPTLDTLEQALRHMPEYATPPRQGRDTPSILGGVDGEGGSGGSNFAQAYSNWQTGIQGILAQLDKTLGELGVKKIEAIGKKFDPHFHEAVREVESEKDDGTITDELQSGFILNGKVIRPTQAVISKKKL